MASEPELEVIVEPDVVPRGTVDLRALDAPAGAPPPRVRVGPNGLVLEGSQPSPVPVASTRFDPEAATRVAPEPVPFDPEAATPLATPVAVPLADDHPQETPTLLALEQAARAPAPPRPPAASAASPSAVVVTPTSGEEFDALELDSGYTAWSLVKVLGYLLALTALVIAVGLHFAGVAPWQKEEPVELASASPTRITPGPSLTPTPSPAPSEPAPAPSQAEASPAPSLAEPGPLESPVEAVPQDAVDALRLMIADTEVQGEVGVEEDAPGLMAKLEGLRAAAVAAQRGGDPAKARAALEELLALHPGDPDALFRLGLSWHSEGEQERAKDCYRRAAEADPRDPRPLNNLSALLLAGGARDEARAALEAALARAPEDAQVLTNLAQLQEGEAPDQSLALYDKALSVAPRLAPARLGRARVRRGRGDREGARADLQALAGEAGASQAPALDALGLMAREDGQTEQALTLLRQAREAAPDYAPARLNLGVTLLDAGRPDEARVELEQAVKLLPRSPRAWQALGVARTQLASVRPELLYEARDAYEQAIKLDPGDWLTHYDYALCAERFGNIPFAMREYERTLQLHPEAWRASANLARLLARGGEPEKARAYLERALAQAPGEADLYFQQAHLLAHLGRDAEARQALRRFLELAGQDDPRRAEALRGLGEG